MEVAINEIDKQLARAASCHEMAMPRESKFTLMDKIDAKVYQMTRGQPYRTLRQMWIAMRDFLFPWNKLSIRTLDRSWHDRTTVIVHANMQILCDFVENEKPFEFIDWESDEGHSHAAAVINDLYNWWNYDPLARDEEAFWQSIEGATTLDDLLEVAKLLYPGQPDNPVVSGINACRKYQEEKGNYKGNIAYLCMNFVEEECERIRNEKLHDLITIRQFLWT
jgi:hypothetical protein